MFNLLKKLKKNKKKLEEKKDASLDYYKGWLEIMKEEIEKDGFKFMQVEVSTDTVNIITKEDFLKFDIKKSSLAKNGEEWELELPHGFYYFYSKERAMEVQLMWVNYLLEYQEKNKTN